MSLYLNLEMDKLCRMMLPTSFVIVVVIGSVLGKTDCGEDAALSRRYDYIIVGAGNAGCTLANRLSEDRDVSVLLLEAGGSDLNRKESPTIITPSFWRSLLGSNVTWPYELVPQRSALFSSNNMGSEQMGKVLGGGSTVGACIYGRGHAADYDNWAALGANGWSYQEVLPYFRKSEGNQDPELQNSPYHGQCGPYTITTANPSRVQDLAIEGSKQLGFREIDCNQPSNIGVCKNQQTVLNGERVSVATAFCRPAMGRDNIRIVTDAFVTKVLIRGRRAYGVQYKLRGRTRTARANLEVILSAGTFSSPKILMLSGVGPRNHLRQLRIRTIVNLRAVGNNLMDHMLLPIRLFMNIQTLQFSNFTDQDTKDLYLFQRKGPIAATYPGVANLFFKTDPPQPTAWPDIHVFFQEGTFWAATGGPNPLEPESLKQRVIPGRNGIELLVVVLHANRTGTVRLRSNNPNDLPLIDPKFLSSTFEIDQYTKAIRKMQDLSRTPAFRAVGTEFEEPFEPCLNRILDTNAYWECYMRHKAFPSFHPTSTCRMGGNRDPNTVVDSRLRVKGIRRLRVVDASIMPEINSAKTGTAAIMIGERAADMIKEDRSYLIYRRKTRRY